MTTTFPFPGTAVALAPWSGTAVSAYGALRPRHAELFSATDAGNAGNGGNGGTSHTDDTAAAAKQIQMNVRGIPPRGPEPV
jgi:hypothetical protein